VEYDPGHDEHRGAAKATNERFLPDEERIMGTFREMSGVIPLSAKVRRLLEQARGVSFARASGLRIVARPGQEGERSVTDFRVFDPTALAGTDGEQRRYDDLAPGAILHAGHIEPDSSIVLSS
jgi:hypothetical protein